MALCYSPFNFAFKLTKFDISPQRADLALLQLAKQSQHTLVFSANLTKQFNSNAVQGYYSFEAAIQKLLSNTGLTVTFAENGQAVIQKASETEIQVDLAKTKPKAEIKTKQILTQSQSIEKIAILGSRTAGRSVDDLPVPVDILSRELLNQNAPNALGRKIQTLAPSFNYPTSAISDGTDTIQPATLRGLGPDQTLVLINGKRRHQASLVHINTSVGRGATGTDFSAIPINAIDHIEILRDGASAQYGSDAIAGVINIVLPNKAQKNRAAISFGQTTKGDGVQTDYKLNHGFELTNEAFINTAVLIHNQLPTNRAGLHGSCLYPNCKQLDHHLWQTQDSRELSAERQVFRIGNPDSTQFAAVINGEYSLDNGKWYGFATYSARENQTAVFFRTNENRLANPSLQDGDATIVNGFLPKIASEIDDISITLGRELFINDDNELDISYSFGKNRIDYKTLDSINASYANYMQFSLKKSAEEIRQQIPRNAYAYGLRLSQHNFNIDGQNLMEWRNLPISWSYGGELRIENYQILPGEPYSYFDYDTTNGIADFTRIGLTADNNAEGGIQGFPGISPVSQVDESLTVWSTYSEFESEVTDHFLLNFALRFDNYNSFASSLTYKLAGNYIIDENLAVRAAISTGFRAPSIQQYYFNNLSTQFVVDENGQLTPEQIGTFRNDSKLTQTLGIPELKQEQSINTSLGAVYHWQKLRLSLDYYHIRINDRIVISNRLGKGLSHELDDALTAAGAGKAQFFINGANTKTRGLDLVATWQQALKYGEIAYTLAANKTKTEVTDLYTPSKSSLTSVPIDAVFSTQDISIIETWQPSSRISLMSQYKRENWQIDLALNRYGSYTVVDGGLQKYGAKWLADLQAKFNVTPAFSVSFGVNNIFDTTPDTNQIGNARSGKIIDANGNTIVDSDGVFQFSRRSTPFGFNGAYYFAAIEYQY